jgi:eukaryotic-like serine/threonine-protein kinase
MTEETPERWRRIAALFDEAVKLAPERRVQYLATACGSDADLLRRVEELLEASGQAAGFLERPVLSRAAEVIGQAAAEPPPESSPRIEDDPSSAPTHSLPSGGGSPGALGPYLLSRRIGEGGMGEVWLAEQREPIRRMVALKIIKPGMDSKQVIARFEVERQALALMSHPHVAKVFDAGLSADGRPYFVMEYVPGVAVTEYCDRQKLPIRERLELFIQACEAVRHAHQKGIIHRDIKPSNVLVCRENDRAAVKVIDFGVAKAMGQKLTDRTLYTELGMAIGTPEYMSPEQAGMTDLDVDTRADIYSLGVVLYELLVGALPFDPKELRKAGNLEMLRIIREVEPPRPSTRIQSLGATGEEVARRRMTDLPTLTRLLSSELEWITLKALEKDPARRYPSASEFASDVRRYLDHEAVQARPQTVWYRTRKFVRRNRLPVAAAAALLLSLLAGLAVSTALYFQAAAARDRARREAAKAQAINSFLQETIGSPEPGKQGRQVLVVDALQRAAAKADASFSDQPEVRAELHRSIGGVFDHLGMADQVEREILKVLEYDRKTLGENARDTLETLIWLGTTRFEAHRYEEAIQDFTKALERGRAAFGVEDTTTIEAMHLLGNVYNLSGRQQEAEPLILEALRLRERVSGPEHFLTARTHMSLAELYTYSLRFDQAEKEWRRAIDILMKRVGEVHWMTLRSQEELADVYIREGRLDLAEPLARRTLEVCRRELGEMHTETGVASGVVASLDVERGNFAEAEAIVRDQVARHRQSDMGDKTLPFALQRLAGVLAREGKDESKEIGAQAVAAAVEAYGEPHRAVADALRTYAFTLTRARHPDYSQAEAVYRKAIAMYRGLFGDAHPYLAAALKDLAILEHTRGRHDEAAKLFSEALGIFESLHLDAPWATFELRARMGGCLVEAGRYAEAERPLTDGYEFLRSRRGDADRLTVEALRHRIALLNATQRRSEADALTARLPHGG